MQAFGRNQISGQCSLLKQDLRLVSGFSKESRREHPKPET